MSRAVLSVTQSLYLGHSVRMCCLVSRSASSQGRATGSLQESHPKFANGRVAQHGSRGSSA